MSYDEHYSNYYTYELGNMLLPNALIEEVERIAKEREDLMGLEECYKKVCKVSHHIGCCVRSPDGRTKFAVSKNGGFKN